jgi:hypothetical protein
VPALRAADLALKFLLELGALAAFAYWGTTAADGALSVVLAIAAPAMAIGLWSQRVTPDGVRPTGSLTRAKPARGRSKVIAS